MADKKRKIEKVNQFIEELLSDVHITVALRNIIFDSSPGLMEEYEWIMPNYSYYGLVCYPRML